MTFSVDNSYDFQFLVTDYFTSTSITRNIGTGFTLMDFNASGKGMGIGKVSEKNMLEVGLETEFNKTTYLDMNSGDAFHRVKRTDSGTEIAFGVGSGGINHGLWSYALNKWMIYGDASNVYLNGTADKANKIGISTRNTTDTWMPVYRDGYLEYTQRQIVNSVTHTDYPNNQDWLPTKSFLSYWNGAYNSSGNSNLSKCAGGTICAEKSKSIVAAENDTSSYIVLGSLLVCWGNTTITPVKDTPTSKTINFPKSFSLKPVVVCTPSTSVPGTTVLGVGANEITGTGCKLWVTRTGTASTSVLWIAIGQAS